MFLTVLTRNSFDLAKGQRRIDFEANDDFGTTSIMRDESKGLVELLRRIVEVSKVNDITKRILEDD